MTRPVVEFLTTNPKLLLTLTVVMRAALAYQRGLTYPEYVTLHAGKRALFPTLDRLFEDRFRSFVNPKGGRDDAEFITHVDTGRRGTADRLRAGGGSFHLLSSLKRRGDQYSALHLVWTHDDGTQTEAYCFEADDGGLDVYVHHEQSVADPVAHLSERPTDGDPRGVVTAALAE